MDVVLVIYPVFIFFPNTDVSTLLNLELTRQLNIRHISFLKNLFKVLENHWKLKFEFSSREIHVWKQMNFKLGNKD